MVRYRRHSEAYVRHVTCLFVVFAMLCAGCASPGPPKPPSLCLPQPVSDLTAERVGDQVLLHWTTPTLTTDDMDISGAMFAEVCRETNAKAKTLGGGFKTCAPICRFSVRPGPSEIFDPLPIALKADPVTLLTYRVQIFNSKGHSAGESIPAAAAGGQAPGPVISLKAGSAEQGVILEWLTSTPLGGKEPERIELKRVSLTSTSPPEKKPGRVPTEPPITGSQIKASRSKRSVEESSNEVHLRADDNPADSGKKIAGTVDRTAEMAESYTYIAQRIRSVRVGTRILEIRSQVSAPVAITLRDTFPPKVPTGLATIAGEMPVTHAGDARSYIDLSWEPNSETDLAGYRVYRQSARPDGSPQGPLARLTATPIPNPAYRDVAVRAGQGYIYSVTAVDANENESAPSAKATEVIKAQQ